MNTNFSTTGYIYEMSFCDGKYRYVGSTKNDYKNRYKQHLRDLKKGKHANTIMNNIYKKYKEDPHFRILLILENENVETLFQKEQEYIDSGYFNLNICKKVGQPQPVKVKVIQYSTEGYYIKVWDSSMEASQTLNIHPTSIRNCTYDLTKTAGGYQWKKWEENFENNIGKVNKIKPKPPITEKEINIYDLYGRLKYKCSNRDKCSEVIGIKKTYIHKVKNKKFYKGFYICDKSLYNETIIEIPIRRIGKYDMNGNLLKIYGEPTEAMKDINKPNTHIFAVLKGKQKSCFGHTYRYIDGKIHTKIKI